MADVSPLFQIMIGGLMTLAGGALVQWMTLWREREVRKHGVEEHRNRQRAEFQLKTLLELQDAMTDLTKAATDLWAEAYAAFKETGQWGLRDSSDTQTLSPERSEKYGVASHRVSVLKIRVLDPSLRSLLDSFENMAMRTAIGRTPDEARQYFDTLPKTFTAANDRLGEILRSLL
jgi:hypothetical protein